MRSDYIDTAVRVAEVSDAEKRCIGILIARYKTTISRLHAGDVVFISVPPRHFILQPQHGVRFCIPTFNPGDSLTLFFHNESPGSGNGQL
jgi:hypothetical protein